VALVDAADDGTVFDWFIACQTASKAAWWPGTDWRAARDAGEARKPESARRGNMERFKALLWERDGWRCRYCSIRVVDPRACEVLAAQAGMPWWKPPMGDGKPRGRPSNQHRHAVLAVTASPEHVVPASWGGRDELENLVTACWCCQFGLGNWDRELLQVRDPLARAPVVDGWDGLARLLA
jgi:hypothetical protein